MRVQISISVDEETNAKFRRLCEIDGRRLNDEFRWLVNEENGRRVRKAMDDLNSSSMPSAPVETG